MTRRQFLAATAATLTAAVTPIPSVPTPLEPSLALPTFHLMDCRFRVTSGGRIVFETLMREVDADSLTAHYHRHYLSPPPRTKDHIQAILSKMGRDPAKNA